MLQITVRIRNHKTCRSWARFVHDIDLSQRGGYAIIGDSLTNSGSGDDEYLTRSADGSIVAVGYTGGSHKNQEQWCALVQVESGAEDSASGDVYGNIDVKGGRILGLWSDYSRQENVRQAAEWGAPNEKMKKAQNPNYMAALYLQQRAAPLAESMTLTIEGETLVALRELAERTGQEPEAIVADAIRGYRGLAQTVSDQG